MPRRLIALLIACYAIAFAFGAMAAIRWPSLMMVADLILQEDPTKHIQDMDWRRVGIAHGAPYFLAALCLYASAVMISNRRKGGVLWYLMGLAAGFPCVFLVSFRDGWWLNPSAGEGAVTGAAAGAVLLAVAVWELRRRRPIAEERTKIATDVTLTDAPASPAPVKKRRYRPVPPAIAMQRQAFARQGAEMRARQRRG